MQWIFFTYCFLRLDTICFAVCHVMLMQYLSDLSYTFHHLVGEITKDIATHWKTLPITHYRVSTFAAVLKGIFFIYCFLCLDTICVAVCHVILMQYLCRLSYTFRHLVGELQKTLQRIAKLCSLNRCEVSTTFLTFWSWFPLFLHFTFCTICISAYCADCFGYFQQHGKICNVIKFRFTQKAGITQKVIDYSQQLKQPH